MLAAFSLLSLIFSVVTASQISFESTGHKAMRSLNVGIVQYPLVGSMTAGEMVGKVRSYVSTAKSKGSELVMLPELFSLDLVDFTKPVPPQLQHVAHECFTSVIQELQDLAVEYGVHLLAGSLPFETQEKKIRNRSFLFSPEGKSVFQDKIFLTPDEVGWGWEGSTTLSVFETPWGNTAISICYDSEFPLISETLTGKPIDLLLVPSMTGDEGFTRVRWATQARAVEHMAYVLVTGTTGAPAEGWEMKAQGAALGPSLPGFTPTIAEGDINADSIVFATLDFTQLAEAKARGAYYPALNEQNATLELTTGQLV
jgi:predicted amidohydrolase